MVNPYWPPNVVAIIYWNMDRMASIGDVILRIGENDQIACESAKAKYPVVRLLYYIVLYIFIQR